MFFSLAFSTFLAGLLTFLAPCTFPLIPAYLAFIGNISLQDLQQKNRVKHVKKIVFLNGVFYVLGFSLAFICLGSLFTGITGLTLGRYRLVLARWGGLFVFILGLAMMRVFELPVFHFLQTQKTLPFSQRLTPGKPLSSFLFGAAFAVGWTPCIGPILGSVLLLSSSSDTILQGALLLSIFSLGLGLPFLLLALGIGQAAQFVKRVSPYLHGIAMISGAAIAILGLLMLTGRMGIWTKLVSKLSPTSLQNQLLRYF